MWEYIVLGNVPGTNLYISFYVYAVLLAALSSGTITFRIKHRITHRRQSMLIAGILVENSVSRPKAEPIQLQLF